MTPTPAATRDLTVAEHVAIRQSAAAVQRRWQGRMNVETIDRFLTESLDIILPKARIRTWSRSSSSGSPTTYLVAPPIGAIAAVLVYRYLRPAA